MQERLICKTKPAWAVIEVNPRQNYVLDLLFNDGSRKIFDASDYVKRPFAAALQNSELFMRAHIVGPTVGWNNEIDIAPELLYKESQVVEG